MLLPLLLLLIVCKRWQQQYYVNAIFTKTPTNWGVAHHRNLLLYSAPRRADVGGIAQGGPKSAALVGHAGMGEYTPPLTPPKDFMRRFAHPEYWVGRAWRRAYVVSTLVS